MTTNRRPTHAALDLTFSNYFSRYEPGIFGPIRDTLLNRGDYYMYLADSNPTWRLTGRGFKQTRMAGSAKRSSMACSGPLSSDRSIWGIRGRGLAREVSGGLGRRKSTEN